MNFSLLAMRFIPTLLICNLFAGSSWAADSAMMVHNAWARPTVQGQQGGGGFMTLMNHGKADDKLLSASSPAAARVELHTMSMEGEVMKMRQLPNIAIKAGETLELKPGGMHVMFMDIKKPLENGSKVPVTFEFEKAGKVTVDFQIMPRPKFHMSGKDGEAHEGHKH
jgi:periplasmic copper chaperone A